MSKFHSFVTDLYKNSLQYCVILIQLLNIHTKTPINLSTPLVNRVRFRLLCNTLHHFFEHLHFLVG